MSNANDSRQEPGGGQEQPSSEQDHAGNSGEGAASALAQLKTQTKQHRRQLGDSEDPSGGPGR